MSDFLENLSPKDKLIFFGGGALVIFFLVKTLTGSKTAPTSAGPDRADEAIKTSNDAATAEQAFEADITNQLEAMSAAQEAAQAKTTQGIADMFSAFKLAQNSAISVMGASIKADAIAQATAAADAKNLINQMGRTPVYTASQYIGGGAVGQTVSGYSVPLMTSDPHITTQADLGKVIGTSVGPAGNGLVTVATKNGTSTVLAGSVFDPTSGNYNPNL